MVPQGRGSWPREINSKAILLPPPREVFKHTSLAGEVRPREEVAMPITAILGAIGFINSVICLVCVLRAGESGNEKLVWIGASAFVAWVLVAILAYELAECPA